MPQSNKSQWLAESLRLTAFPALQPALDPCGSWKALIENEPETMEARPREHVIQESGPFREATLTFKYAPFRVDWMLHPSEKMAWDACPNIGVFVEQVPPFVDLMKKWLATAPEIKRLALGAVLLSPVSSHDEGYKELSEYLPFDLDLKARNVKYQVNRRRPSRLGIPGLEINRLSNWSCQERKVTSVTAQLTADKTTTVREDSPSNFAVRLEVDINTVPEYPEPLAPANLADLFSEFVDLAAEIAEKGDIP
jgi:hypothetical protein